MKCPRCNCLDDKVIDSRMAKDGAAIRRRRQCTDCEHRFTTYEEIEELEMLVVKQNNAREPFERDKLLGGLKKACQKRPVGIEVLETAAKEIAGALADEGRREIPSKHIGLKVMEKLQDIDPVAYVRFASVYRQFQAVGEFIDEIEHLEQRPERGAKQPDLFESK
jgi:transcriptional repressor NrdR